MISDAMSSFDKDLTCNTVTIGYIQKRCFKNALKKCSVIPLIAPYLMIQGGRQSYH